MKLSSPNPFIPCSTYAFYLCALPRKASHQKSNIWHWSVLIFPVCAVLKLRTTTYIVIGFIVRHINARASCIPAKPGIPCNTVFTITSRFLFTIYLTTMLTYCILNYDATTATPNTTQMSFHWDTYYHTYAILTRTTTACFHLLILALRHFVTNRVPPYAPSSCLQSPHRLVLSG